MPKIMLGYRRIPKIVRGYQTSISFSKLKELLPSGWKDKPDWSAINLYIFIARTCRKNQFSEYIVPSRYLSYKLEHCHPGIQRKLKKLADLGLLEKSHFLKGGEHFTKLELTNNFHD